MHARESIPFTRYRHHMASKDLFDELIEQGTERDPRFPLLVDEAYERRRNSDAIRRGCTCWHRSAGGRKTE